MYWKSVIIFLSICFIILVSLEAIADDNPPTLYVAEVKINLEGQAEIAKAQETTKASDQTCDKKKKISDSTAKTFIKVEALKSQKAEAPNLSFNFIYYILYKFKYIDSFGLSAPEKSTQPKKEDIVWH